MRMLVIEDDRNKINHISQALKPAFPDALFDFAYSYRSGLRAILSNSYDLIILDISLPTYDLTETEAGFQFRRQGGREILLEMKRKRRNFRTLVLTQFETFGSDENVVTLKELTEQLRREFGDVFIGSIYYNASESNWKVELIDTIKRLKVSAIC